VEDAKHFLLSCPNYNQPHTKLREKAGHNAYSIPYLTNTAKGTWHLLCYINDTKRFSKMMGELWNGATEELWRDEEDKDKDGWVDVDEEEVEEE
jgi:hypothetical protein